MKVFLILLLLFAWLNAPFSQITEVIVPKNPVSTQMDTSQQVYVFVDWAPVFNYKNGTSTHDSFLKYVNDNIKIPSKDCFGKIYIQFVVKPDSTVKDIKILRGLEYCKDYKKELQRIIASMPKWTPGKLKGESVSVLFTMPIDVHPND